MLKQQETEFLKQRSAAQWMNQLYAVHSKSCISSAATARAN